MKYLLLVTLALSIQVQAASKAFKACDAEQLTELTKSMKEWQSYEGSHMAAAYLTNKESKIIGYYLWEEGNAHAAVCEYLDNNDVKYSTIANEWYYWQSDELSSAPKDWKKGNAAVVAQDEGLAHMTVLKASKNNGPTVKFQVFGYTEDETEEVVKEDILTLSPL